MNEKIGLSGYLAPDGEWYPCDYKEHDIKAVELVDKYKLDESDCNNIALHGDFIKFGTVPWVKKEGCSECHVFMNPLVKPTNQQIRWLKQNLAKATDKQKREALLVLTAIHNINFE